MAEAGDEIEGTVRRVVFRAPDGAFAVVRIDVEGRPQPVTVVGPLGELREGENVVVSGRWEKHDAHGEQLRALRAVAAPPRTEGGVRRYLEGLPGLGPSLAERLVATLGVEAIDVLADEPWRAAQVRGVGKARAARASKAALERKKEREVMIFLQGLGVSRAYAARIRKAYGDEAIARVRENPYRLARDVDGIGFLVADRIARGMGVAPEAPERREAALLHALDTLADEGHVRAGRPPLYARAEALLCDDERPADVEASDRAIARLAEEGAIVREIEGDVVYLARMHRAEVALARRVLQLLAAERAPAPSLLPDARLSEGQRVALASIGEAGVAVLTGGPGTGKTTVVRNLVKTWEAARRRVLLAAPTGRASRRLAEASGRDALTLHRLLEWGRGNGQSGFGRDAAHPLEADLIVVDEASMIDLPLARALFEACPLGARVVLVGDVDQLPSVGPGQVLSDLIASQVVPVARLTEVFRQAEGSGIVDNAYRVLRGEVPAGREPPAGRRADFYVIEAKDAADAERLVLRAVQERIPRAFGLDPVRDVQVLAPMHRGQAGTERLNAALAESLAADRPVLDLPPSALLRGDRQRVLRLRDKVMQVRNDYDRDVFNGDIGFVAALLRDADGAPSGIAVDFDGRRVEYDLDALGALELAYAISIHKSQGSEYPAVVVPLCAGHHLMLRRNLLYTAITRGKSLVVLVVEPRALARAVGVAEGGERDTGLAARLAATLALTCWSAGCGDDFRDFDAAVVGDAGIPDEGLLGEGGVPVGALFTISGCDALSFDVDARPRCVAPRQRPLTFIPLGVGVTTVVWSFPHGAPASSNLLTPEAAWAQLGTFTVSLAAGGGGGTALGTGTLQISAGGPGSACAADEDCDASVGLTCLCGAGSACPASLGAGLCVRRCESAACAPGEACIDLARGGVAASSDGGVGDGGASDPFRVRACLPTCATSASCRAGFDCRELPEVSPGAPIGGPYLWAHACFAPVLGDVGASCAAPDGTVDGSQCITGRCEGLGARGVCTDLCDVDSPCPSTAACVTMPSVGARCLHRCAAGDVCGDPLLTCQGPGAGGLGFSLPPAEPITTTLCAARRCSTPADCAPAGTCVTVGGAKFCQLP